MIVAREVGLQLELDGIEVEAVVPLDAVRDVERSELIDALQALDEDFSARIRAAKAQGSVLRYIGRIEDGKCRVAIEAVPLHKPLGAIRDGENALVLLTRYYQPIPLILRGYGAGAAVTAAGVFGDILRTVWRPLDQQVA